MIAMLQTSSFVNISRIILLNSVVQAIEAAIDKLSRHHVRHIKAYDPNEGEKILKILAKTRWTVLYNKHYFFTMALNRQGQRA